MIPAMKIDKTYHVKNSLYDKHKGSPYDIVMIYCKSCNSKMDIRVYHSFGKLEYYQLNNLPNKISNNLDTRKIKCSECNVTNTLQKQPIKTITNYKIL